MSVRRFTTSLFAATAGLAALMASSASAHFIELLPDQPYYAAGSARPLALDLRFTHPMEQGPLMDMVTPDSFGVLTPSGPLDLLDSLEIVTEGGVQRYAASFTPKMPGAHIFHVTPAPYWEPAEGKFIKHYTKVVVDVADGGGWEELAGLPVEIQPLIQPYGLWSGNQFRGVVLKEGKPVPHVTLEVEWHNDGSMSVPDGPYITQEIKTDANGVFSYGLARGGWWGFAALIEADETMTSPDGQQVPVELGGLIWVHAKDMK